MSQQGPQLSMENERKKIKAMLEIDESLYALNWTLGNLIGTGGAVVDPIQKQGDLNLVNIQQSFQHYIFPSWPGSCI